MRKLAAALKLIAFLPGVLLQLAGMALTFLGWTIMVLGIALRLIGAVLTGALIVTRGVIRLASRA